MSITDNLLSVRARVAAACQAVGRDPGSVRLLAISKTQPASLVRQAIQAGCQAFGENRVQEMVAKAGAVGPGAQWSLVGHLQRNKAALALSVMGELQSLDSIRLADVLQRHLAVSARRLPVLIEVNTSGEASKHGIAPDEVLAFTAAVAAYPNLRPVGLMTVAHPDPARAAAGFDQLAQLREQLRRRDGGGWPELSMGMSGDFESAIAHGSTCLRIGTAIFGARPAGAPGGRDETIEG